MPIQILTKLCICGTVPHTVGGYPLGIVWIGTTGVAHGRHGVPLAGTIITDTVAWAFGGLTTTLLATSTTTATAITTHLAS